MKTIFMIGIALSSITAFAAMKKKNIEILTTSAIVVAVVDTGADIYHSELKDSIWTNPGESGLDKFGNNKENNKIDDDGNGFVDDLHGWNFIENNHDLSDQIGHGTHVSGIISKQFQKYRGFRKKPAALKIMILKYYDAKATSLKNLEYSNRALNYANQMRANIINYSGGGAQSSSVERKIILESQRLGILLVAAAGNNQSDCDLKFYFPASYGFSNIISVAAVDNSGKLLSFSNFGKGSIDVAAPGKWILSTLPGNKYGVLSGTSQSTAHVSGVAAAVAAGAVVDGMSYKASSLRTSVINLGTFKESLVGKTRSPVAFLHSEMSNEM